MKFTPRTTAPSKDNRYYYKDNAYYKNGYGMPNCTAYVYGRVYELLGYIPSGLYYGNAENWYDNTKNLEKGKTPKLGAIACYRTGKAGNSSDGAGHVAIVEKINGDNFECSNSAYKGTNFYMTKGYDTKNNKTFQGFIYLPVDFEEEKEETPSKIDFKVGNKVVLKSSATTYQGNDKGVKIPDSVKNKEYTIQEIDSKGNLLLKEIYSWVLGSECELAKTTQYITYTIKKGDTLSEIAEEYNTTIDELVRINNIEDADLIITGNKLKIPK